MSDQEIREPEDTEGQKKAPALGETEEDAEGQRLRRLAQDDTEGQHKRNLEQDDTEGQMKKH